MNRIRDEAEAAKEIKQDIPVMVVLGNPPYSYDSVNTDPWIVNLVRDYYQVDGKPLGERNPKGLLDDYVKFIRFAQHRVETTGYGVVALITNHGYLDNPTFRGMRQHLMQTFDEIYILDLHGNSKKKEISPNGSSDQNVFDIQQGVAISIFVKHPENSQELATVYHADLWDKRESYQDTPQGKELVGGKYHWLAENNVSSTEWEFLEPRSPFYLFKHQDTDLLSEYDHGWKVTEIMLVNSLGLTTARDKLTIHFTESSTCQTVTEFSALSTEEARAKYSLGKDTRDWKINLAQKDLKESGVSKSCVTSILYRPFDRRYNYYTGKSRGFHCMPRSEVMNHMVSGSNLILATLRRPRNEMVYNFWVGNAITDKCVISSLDNANIFPLYPTEQTSLFDTNEPTDAPGNRRPNLAPEFIPFFKKDDRHRREVSS